MAITKEMPAKCQNEQGVVFCKLPKDVQGAMKAAKNSHVQFMSTSGEWVFVSVPVPVWLDGVAYRLRPDTPCEPEYEVCGLDLSSVGYYCLMNGRYVGVSLTSIVGNEAFAGILYRAADGTETWRTAIDCAFGTPIKARFVK
jgi:hypothetical protein